MWHWHQQVAAVGLTLTAVAGAFLAIQLPTIVAGGLLFPVRHRLVGPVPPGCEDVRFNGAEVTLSGWWCAARTARRGSLIYLHGVADNRASVRGILHRFTARGFDVVAYDSRAHGESTGDACTYGFYEKHDLRRVIDAGVGGPIVLVGTSLGAAVALQAASEEPRVSAVVAVETFSDLRTVARERAPFFLTRGAIDRAFAAAEARGRFSVDAVNPARAAGRIVAPVLLVHGAVDVDTPPNHSRRVLAALGPSAQLILVDGAGHNQSLGRPEVWMQIESWLEATLSAAASAIP